KARMTRLFEQQVDKLATAMARQTAAPVEPAAEPAPVSTGQNVSPRLVLAGLHGGAWCGAVVSLVTLAGLYLDLSWPQEPSLLLSGLTVVQGVTLGAVIGVLLALWKGWAFSAPLFLYW